jgi:deoxyribonuclease-4
MSIVGIHINNNDDIFNNIKNAHTKGAKIIQLFANKFSKKSIEEYKKIYKLLKKYKIKCVVHSSYTINLSKNWDEHSWTLKQLLMEIKNTELLGGFAIIVHLGKQLNLSENNAINNMYTALLYVLSKSFHSNVKILLETSSGQGSELLFNLQKFGDFINKFKKTKFFNKIGICIDTCHIFVAGYDIREKINIIKIFKFIDKNIGFENIKLVHLNDSVNDINSHIDRHANLGKGFIGKKALLVICNFFNELQIPIILETPYENIFADLNILLKN